MIQNLEEYEEIIFETIQEYLNKKRVFYMEKLIPYLNTKISKSNINIANGGIQKILLSLVKKNMIVEGTTLTKKDVLLNSKRKEIYNYIEKNPGKYVTKIAKELKISSNVVFWHLKILTKFNFIEKKIIDNHIVYFDSNIDLKESKKIYVFSKEKSKRIINYLKTNNLGITRTKLARVLNIHRNTIKKYIKSLEEFNIIYKINRSNQLLYFLKEN
ncbi:MAG: winged helix-turn-helix transcriptional regulator [Promethearchaeota archaeon]